MLVAIILLIANSCQKDTERDDFSANLMVALREAFVEGERHAGLYVFTLEEYPCSNFEIDYNYTHVGGVRTIVFKGIPTQEECLAVFGPARAFIDLGEMDEGSHTVNLEVKHEILNTHFQVNDQRLIVNVLNGHHPSLGFHEKTMHRLPENYVWGYVHPKVTGEDEHYPVFLQKLLDSGATQKHLQPGNYGFFRVGQEDFYLFDNVDQYTPEQPFVIKFDNDFHLLEDIATNFRDDCVIALYSAKGHVYYNQ